MKKYFQKVQQMDERIETLQNRIYKEMYFLILLISIISVMVKTYSYGYNINLITTELVIIVIPALYYGVRAIWLGIYRDELEMEERASRIPIALKNVIVGTGIGLVIALYFGIRSALIYGDDGIRLYYFFLVFSASLAIYAPFFIIVLLVPYLLAKGSGKRNRTDDDE